MPYNASRKSREKRLRAYYRKKAWTAGIVMLIIGLLVGFIGCTVLLKTNDGIADLLGFGPQAADLQPEVLATPAPIQASSVLDLMNTQPTEVPTAVPTAEPTAVPTEVPTAEPTEAPTEVPTQEPAAEPVVEIVAVIEEPAAEVTAEPTVEATAVPTEEPTQAPTAEPTEAPTEAPTAEPTQAPTAEPTAAPKAAPVVVPYGEAKTIRTEIAADGSARKAASADAYETLDLTLQVKAYKDQAYYVANYADSYILQGNEAAVEFEITLNGYAGSAEILPQNVLDVYLIGEDESIFSAGYQLIDAEIEGKPGIVLTSDKATTVYKRYPYSVEQGDMVYMVVKAYVNGVEHEYRFEIISPEPVETPVPATSLTIGSSGEEVKKLQAKLIDMGLLSGQPDGKFGKYTAEAIKTLQGRYGMEKTGVADAAFLDKLYG